MMNQSRGFAIVSALFLIVILSLVAAFIVTLAAFTRSTSTFALSGARADYAAWSGIEWGIRQAVVNSSCSSTPTVLNLTEGGLRNFKATVTCAVNTYLEGGVNVNMYRITSLGEYKTLGDQDYVSRQWQVMVSQ